MTTLKPPPSGSVIRHLDSEHGRFTVATHHSCVVQLRLPNAEQPDDTDASDGATADTAVAQRAVDQLREYLAGTRTDFDLPLDPDGTDFQRQVWFALAEIGYGETVSYTEIATRVGRPSAVRAVGAANGANPIAVFLPCHRVIGAGGSLTGYGGGLPLKQALLSLESGALTLG